jgi:hypothetical protein
MTATTTVADNPRGAVTTTPTSATERPPQGRAIRAALGWFHFTGVLALASATRRASSAPLL